MGQGHWPLAFEAAGGWGKGLMRGQFFKLRTNSVAYGRRLELEHVSVTSCVATCTAVQCSARVLNLVLGRLSGLALLCLGLRAVAAAAARAAAGRLAGLAWLCFAVPAAASIGGGGGKNIMFYPQSMWVIEVVCSLCSCPKCS